MPHSILSPEVFVHFFKTRSRDKARRLPAAATHAPRTAVNVRTFGDGAAMSHRTKDIADRGGYSVFGG